MMHKAAPFSLIIGLALSFAAEPALAAGNFTAETAATWVSRSDRLYRAGSLQGSDDFEVLKANAAEACDGITGEIARPNIPDWAQRSQLYFCHSLDGLNNRFQMKAMCKNMKTAFEEFNKANPAKDPPEVVTAAANMAILSGVLADVFKQKHYCR